MSKEKDLKKMCEIAQKLSEEAVAYMLPLMETALFVQEAERERARKKGDGRNVRV